MKKVKDSVKSILLNSEAATDAFFNGYLNFSAYAKNIKEIVEDDTKKDVSIGNIVVTLSRINREENSRLRKTKHEFIPDVKFSDISVKSSLVELTFDNTLDLRKKINLFGEDFYYFAIGLNEITIIVTSENSKYIQKKLLPAEPKVILSGLSSVTVRFSPDYMTVPNTVYAILRKLALEFINVIEIVSTYTEITIIVEHNEMLKTFEVLNR